ncbi:MAG: DNA-processing protein DprA, partial [Vulcanimicrobiaceae bacterium]
MGLEAPRRIEPEELAAVRPRAAESLRNHPLYLVGGLEGLARPTVAIVGTRAPSEPGRQRARDLAAALGSAGICVVSGLALGIDGAAHEGALAATAPTVGVLGGGHRRFFPNRNLG